MDTGLMVLGIAVAEIIAIVAIYLAGADEIERRSRYCSCWIEYWRVVDQIYTSG